MGNTLPLGGSSFHRILYRNFFVFLTMTTIATANGNELRRNPILCLRLWEIAQMTEEEREEMRYQLDPDHYD